MKTRIHKVVVCTTALIAAMAATAVNADDGGRVYLNPMLGSQYFSSGRDLGRATVKGLGIEYRFTPNWAAEIRYLETNPDIRGTREGVDLNQFFLDGLYYFGTSPRLEPYLALGLGHAEFSTRQSDSREAQVNAGFGLRYHFDSNWSARLDARALHGLDDDHTDRLVGVSLSYAFGGTPTARAAAAPAAPAPAPARTPREDIDSDGDGVPDYRDDCPDTPPGLKVDERGCPYTLTEEVSITLQVNFAVDAYQVPEAYIGEIRKVAEFLQKYADTHAEIEGHTDSTGSAAYNQALSQRRAEAVVRVLVDRFGIDRQRLTPVGYGEERPVASNATAEGRLANRRVVATVRGETEVPAQRD